MSFSFIKYTQPAWKFNTIPVSERFSACLYHPAILPFKQPIDVEEDPAYETNVARYADMAYRAWYKGLLIEANQEQLLQIKNLGKPSLNDEYLFIQKMWGKSWSKYVLLRRMLALYNPITELAAYKRAIKFDKLALSANPIDYSAYDAFKSKLVADQPLVSVIIPTLNRYAYLKDVLADLEKQTYTNFDVIVVDQSSPFRADFYEPFQLRLQVMEQKEKLLWTARNNAIKASKADYLLFFDDDSRVDPDWIEQHVKTLDFFNADISAGVSLSVVGGKVPESYSYFRLGDQFDSGNALVKRAVFKKIGLFDLQFNKQSMGDGEFGMRAHIHGLKNISNPFAKRVHLKVSAGGLREIGHWDGFRPKKLFAPKPIPSVVYLYKKYFTKSLFRESLVLGIILSNISYKNKRQNNNMVKLGVLSMLKFPLLAIQITRSLRRANAMLQQGDKIEWLP